MKPITENIIERSAIEILQLQGWEYNILTKSNKKQTRTLTLTQLRDTLLPKLMSGAVSLSNCGEVRVKN
jgi:ribonuclease HIII